MRIALSLLVGTISIFAHTTAQSAEQTLPDEVHFNRDIRPILSNYCFTCHGPDEGQRQTDLRLDLEESAFAELESGVRAIVPGDVKKSELYFRISTDDDTFRMPPEDFEKELTERQVALIKKWIEGGAKWEPHWNQVPPRRGDVPPAVAEWKPTGPIDRFVHARLKNEGVEPAGDADRRTLVRRLYFDLIGLPPSPEEVEAFVKDDSPDAYEKVVDRLLDSKHFGERMAVWWLDLVRYADSIGYHSDNPRDVWMYRDWVIQSFNENKPFDQFTIEQLAGDLLPDPTNQHKIASGYNRLLQTTQEGGAQPKEYMAKYMADRVRNVSEVWMGATMGCAECHDHKYDPYTQKDFYSMAAFFADIKEPGVGARKPVPMPTPEFERKLAALDAQIADAEKNLRDSSADLDKAQAKWEAELRDKLGTDARSDLVWIDDQRVPEGEKSGDWNYITKDQGPVHSGNQSRKQSAGGNVQHYVYQAKDTINLGEGDMLFAYIYLDPKNPPQEVMLQFNDGSWEHRAFWGEDKIPYGGVGSDGPNHRKMGPLPKTGEWVRLEVSPEQVGLKPGSEINGFAFTQWGGTAYWDASGVNRNGLGLPQNLVDILKIDAGKRTKQQAAALAKHFRQNAPQLAAARQKIDSLKQQKEKLKKQMPVMLIAQTTSPREIRVLPRGNWLDDSGPVVQPDTPEFMTDLGVEDRRATRLDLAQWLLDPENPMTARAQVNRFWMLLYGHGIARTLNDLGGQGEWPTHPKLLDWLAVEFIDSGWDIKHMVRLMVTSRTYRQSSQASPELRQLDPNNKLFARQTRFRLDAEFVRDNALDISGLLVPEIGGPSVKPYQPAGYWQHLNFPKRRWQKDSGDDLYRRGLYTWWQRTFLHPSLLAFDAPSREECTAQRPRSNTPQQALVLLNDPTYVEAARVFAQKIIKQGGSDDAARLRWAFQQALQREPTSEETQVLAALRAKHLAEYRADEADARQLISVGDYPVTEDADPAELAAWTNVARVILNLHETITRY